MSLRAQGVPLPIADDDLDGDLRRLLGEISEARVVAIGESTHYSHEFYELRFRLCRALVEDFGFTAIALESGVPEGFIVDDWIHGDGGPVEEIQSNGITWSLGVCDEMREFLWYLRNVFLSRRASVRFYGVDIPGSQISLLPGITPLEAYLKLVDDALLPLLGELRELAAMYASSSVNITPRRYAAMPQADRDRITALLSDIAAQFIAQQPRYLAIAGHAQYERASRILQSAICFDRVVRRAFGPDSSQLGGAYVRDAGMADMMKWILSRERRVVLMAHNGHIQRTTDMASPVGGSPLGHYLASYLDEEYVSIGTTFGAGHLISVPKVVVDGQVVRSIELREAGPAPDSTIDQLMESSYGGPVIVDLRKLDEHDAAVLDQRTEIRCFDYSVALDARKAFDLLAHVPQLSVYRATSDPPIQHVPESTLREIEVRSSGIAWPRRS